MLTQSLPSSAERYAREQRTEIGAAVAATNRLWQRMGEDFDRSYSMIERNVLAVMDHAQLRVAQGAVGYIPAVLSETGQTRAVNARYEVDPARLVGTAGDGLGTDSLAYGAVTRAKTEIAKGATTAQALRSGGLFLSTAVGTLLSDTGRTAEKMATYSRPVSGFVRMLSPPSCGRCVILAGKFTRRREAFLRHPGCDCRNIPVSEAIAGDITVDPNAYLDSLSKKGLDRALGSQANARAWRDGADRNQLINAYRRGGGVRPAQVYGKTIKYTTEGTTRRGWANWNMKRAGYVDEQVVGRYASLKAPRLMPESIYQISTSKADADRLLRLYGWIL